MHNTPSKDSLNHSNLKSSGAKFSQRQTPDRQLEVSEMMDDADQYSKGDYQFSHREQRGQEYYFQSVDMREIKTDRSKSRGHRRSKSGRSRKSESRRSVNTDYSDENSEAEDKIVKIQVKFKNEDLEKKIESLGLNAKDLTELEVEMEERKRNLELLENELQSFELEHSRKVDAMEVKKDEMKSKISDNESLQKSLEAKKKEANKKNMEITDMQDQLDLKNGELEKEETRIRLKENSIKQELLKTQATEVIVRKHDDGVTEITNKVSKRQAE